MRAHSRSQLSRIYCTDGSSEYASTEYCTHYSNYGYTKGKARSCRFRTFTRRFSLQPQQRIALLVLARVSSAQATPGVTTSQRPVCRIGKHTQIGDRCSHLEPRPCAQRLPLTAGVKEADGERRHRLRAGGCNASAELVRGSTSRGGTTARHVHDCA